MPRYEEEELEDFPVGGPRTVGRDVRQLWRQNLDFLKQHDDWARKSSVKAVYLSVPGHLCIARALRYLVCYDQLQVCDLAAAEALDRRRALAVFVGTRQSAMAEVWQEGKLMREE